ncbi:hypothetical protein VEJY3_12455 [Vibrio sp. EJY3]|nr:hypothetical protein VEJY3_12455 [Vibrio sp. EJY3]
MKLIDINDIDNNVLISKASIAPRPPNQKSNEKLITNKAFKYIFFLKQLSNVIDIIQYKQPSMAI